MKNLLACWVVFAAFSVSAQQYSPPWNPDADDNGSIGATDVLATLSVYGNEWGVDTSLTCDYTPSDSEQWFLDVLTGGVVIDSLLFQQTQLSTAEVFIIGCPDPVVDTLVFEQTIWLFPYNSSSGNSTTLFFESSASPSNDGWAYCSYMFLQGFYELEIQAQPGGYNPWTETGFYIESFWQTNQQLPFNSSLVLNDSGIGGEIWNSPHDNVQFIQLIPYWHYAE